MDEASASLDSYRRLVTLKQNARRLLEEKHLLEEMAVLVVNLEKCLEHTRVQRACHRFP